MKRASKALKKNYHFLHQLLQTVQTGPKRAIHDVVNNTKCCEIKCLSEIVRNLLKGNIPLHRVNYGRIKKHKKFLKHFAKKSLTVKKKRAILKARGSGVVVPLLLGAVLPPVLEFIAKTMTR